MEVSHNSVVVDKLVTRVILGIDFLRNDCLALDFAHNPIRITGQERETTHTSKGTSMSAGTSERMSLPEELLPILEDAYKAKSKLQLQPWKIWQLMPLRTTDWWCSGIHSSRMSTT